MSGPGDRFLGHVADVCERASAGDLEARVLGVPSDGEHRRIGQAINRLLDIADAYVRESAAAMDHCSRDLFHRPILRRGMRGSYAGAAGKINSAAAASTRRRKLTDDTCQLMSSSSTINMLATAQRRIPGIYPTTNARKQFRSVCRDRMRYETPKIGRAHV